MIFIDHYLNLGLKNELDIANYLCGKTISELDEHWQKIIHKMFNVINENDIIYCEKARVNLKEDLIVIAHGVKRTISIKSGNIVTIHCEKVRALCDYLIHLGFTEEQVKILLLYHYGDGTVDGTGAERQSSTKLREIYRHEIKEFNHLVNQKDILCKLLDRFLSYGTINQKGHVDYLYFGTITSGDLFNMQQLMDFFVNRDFINMSSIHFGPFIYCPQNRLINSKNRNEEDRHYTSIKWFGHQYDLSKYLRYCCSKTLMP